MDKLRRVLGFMFNKAEEYNRKHAFMTYYSKYENLGETEAIKRADSFCFTKIFIFGVENLGETEAIKRAVEGVHKTQFQYGKVGMPKILRTPVGRVGLQFSSFSIKQIEFLQKLMKEDPRKVL